MPYDLGTGDTSRIVYPDDDVRLVECKLVPADCHGHDCSFYEIHFKWHDSWWELDTGIATSFGKPEIKRRVRTMFPFAELRGL